MERSLKIYIGGLKQLYNIANLKKKSTTSFPAHVSYLISEVLLSLGLGCITQTKSPLHIFTCNTFFSPKLAPRRSRNAMISPEIMVQPWGKGFLHLHLYFRHQQSPCMAPECSTSILCSCRKLLPPASIQGTVFIPPSTGEIYTRQCN